MGLQIDLWDQQQTIFRRSISFQSNSSSTCIKSHIIPFQCDRMEKSHDLWTVTVSSLELLQFNPTSGFNRRICHHQPWLISFAQRHCFNHRMLSNWNGRITFDLCGRETVNGVRSTEQINIHWNSCRMCGCGGHRLDVASLGETTALGPTHFFSFYSHEFRFPFYLNKQFTRVARSLSTLMRTISSK